jgi:hypothetical protein
LIFFTGLVLFGVRDHDLFSESVATLGLSMLVAVALITGRISVRPSRGRGELSRAVEPVDYWVAVGLLMAILGCVVVHLVRHAFTA